MQYQKVSRPIQHEPSELHTSLKGAKYELLACAWLLEQGYEVFRNVAPVGKGDLVIWKNGTTPILVDVKSGGRSKHPQVKTLLFKNGEFSWYSLKSDSIQASMVENKQ